MKKRNAARSLPDGASYNGDMADVLDRENLIYDWNVADGGTRKPPQTIFFDDETLRDGLQSPSVTTPAIEDKIRIFHLMEDLGIDIADIGLPGAGPHVAANVLRLAQEKVDARMRINLCCAARTVVADIQPIVDVSQKAGVPIRADVFIGSSPIRRYAEDWDLDRMLKHTREAVSFAVRHGLPVMYVTEDTMRADPETVRALYTTAIECGARTVCVCDTVGHAVPDGARALIRFVREIVAKTGRTVRVEWHGHQDRGLGVINSIAALEAGADCVHGTGLGIGERCGNTPMDQLLVNLKLMGWIDNDLRKLADYCRAVSRACRVPIPKNYPVVGDDAFETGTGVHAAAVIKAFKKGDAWLANRVYSGVPADAFGFEQRIRVGPMCGKSNVVWWLEKNGVEPTAERVDRIFAAAKAATRLLTDEEIREILSAEPPPPADAGRR